MRSLFLLLIFLFIAGKINAQSKDTSTLEVFRCFGDEEMPEFPGGQDNLIKYLAENARYPGIVDSEGIKSRCVLRFVVNEDGCISDLEVIRSAGRAVDEEVIKTVSRMPCWKPGKKWGKPVKASFFLPVTICLE